MNPALRIVVRFEESGGNRSALCVKPISLPAIPRIGDTVTLEIYAGKEDGVKIGEVCFGENSSMVLLFAREPYRLTGWPECLHVLRDAGWQPHPHN